MHSSNSIYVLNIIKIFHNSSIYIRSHKQHFFPGGMDPPAEILTRVSKLVADCFCLSVYCYTRSKEPLISAPKLNPTRICVDVSNSFIGQLLVM